MTVESNVAHRVLAGDIGGTNARLAIAREVDGRIVFDLQRVLRVRDFASVADALAEFLSHAPAPLPAHACLAWAGPIDGRSARLTNGAWAVDADALASRFDLPHLALVNDFQAAAAGIDRVAAQDLVVLQPGVADPDATRLVIGAGTGLGVAYAIRGAQGTRIVAGEGGHVAFAPLDDEQSALLAYCRRDLERVTAEHLVSGSGIVRLHAFCCARDGVAVPPEVAAEGAVAVVRRADAGDPAAQRALRLFCAILGAVAGDHALSCLATGGVFVAGGIAAKLAGRMADGTFRAAFNAKGAHAALMRGMPVWLVRDEALGLRGAAAIALADARRA
ncbi:MAG: glucokinase [Betaproteobacteria bacterium]|nr:glucokinase [Betaproteobacteria bacterium]